MAIKQKLTIATLFVTIILFSGCVSETQDLEVGAFVGGSEGLSVYFKAGSPPNEIFETAEFPIILNIENKGETDITQDKPATIYIEGIDVSETGFDIVDINDAPITDAPNKIYKLKGIEKIGNQIIPGEKTELIFKSKGFKGSLSGDYKPTIIGRICYPYETKAITRACVKQNLLNQGFKNKCEVTGVKETYVSGAPIQITHVEQIPLSKTKYGFFIQLENQGSGTPYLPGTDCSGDNNIIKIKDIELEGKKGSCTIDELYFEDNKAKVLCEVDLTQEVTEYKGFLKINLEYEYSQSTSREFTVLSIPG